MRRSYLDYSMSVIVGRALPDVRDGLKPVHRRILFAMSEMGLTPNRAYRKCAEHRRAKCWATTIRTETQLSTTPWSAWRRISRCVTPWLMGRATSARSTATRRRPTGTPRRGSRAIDTALLEDIDKETVDFKPNFDDRRVEPEVLPTRVPNLLINGSSGIAVGMATNFPPHNLTEIINATIALIQNPATPLAKIIEMVPGPDFPTGGFILGRQGIIDAYTKGRGQLKLRAKAAIERMGKDREQIVVTEIPYQVNKSRLIEHAAALVNDKKIEGISEIRDESDREGLRIVFELKRGEQAEVILNNLYKHTQLQIGFGVIMLSIVNGQPRELGLIDCIRYFIDHRVEVVRRRTDFELRKARAREHILLGFQKALDNLDEVIKLIRASGSPREARDSLMKRFEFSDKQAQAIIELQLQRLTGMERQEILNELADIQRRIAEYLEILGSEKVLRDLIVKELKEVQKDFGDERRTQIIEDTGEIHLEDLVAGGRRRRNRHAWRLPEAHGR